MLESFHLTHPRKESEHIAAAWYETEERLAPSFGQKRVGLAWGELLPDARRHRIAAVEYLLAKGLVHGERR